MIVTPVCFDLSMEARSELETNLRSEYVIEDILG